MSHTTNETKLSAMIVGLCTILMLSMAGGFDRTVIYRGLKQTAIMLYVGLTK